MKKITNLKGIKILSKYKQKNVIGMKLGFVFPPYCNATNCPPGYCCGGAAGCVIPSQGGHNCK